MSNIPMGIWAPTAQNYIIPQSIRFNDDDLAYMHRTPSVAGNRKTWTWSGWVKSSGDFTNSPALFSAGNSAAGDWTAFQFTGAGYIIGFGYDGAAYTWRRATGPLFRDSSAWYHIVLSYDTTLATALDRVKLYVNGVQITDFSLGLDNPTLNLGDLCVNNTNIHAIGALEDGTTGNFWDGLLSDIYFIDGAALTTSDFGKFDSNGVWVPKAFTEIKTVLPPSYTDWSTQIGDMTNPFYGNDGVTVKTAANSAQGSGNDRYLGVDWGTGVTKTVTGFVTYGSSNDGMVGSADPIVTLTLYGSNSVPINSTDGASLGSTSGTDALSVVLTKLTGLTTTTPYRYHWVNFTKASGASFYVSELEFWTESDVVGYGTNGFHIDGADATNLGKNVLVEDLALGDAATFDGTNDYVTLSAGLTGGANTKTMFYSGWVKKGADGITDDIFFGVNGGQCHLQINTSNQVYFYCHDVGAGSARVSIVSATTVTVADGWTHILASWDATNAHLYIDGVESMPGVFTLTNVDGRGDFATVSVGASNTGSEKLNGDLADFIYAQEYIDLSVEANRLKFINADGSPTAWSTALAGVTTPLVAMHLDGSEAAANFADNADGTGQAFTVTGTLTTGATRNRIGAGDYATSGLTTADQMLDSPTDDAASGVGNFCTWSPLVVSDLAFTLSDGNLQAVVANDSAVRGTMATGVTGKYYFEITCTNDNTYGLVGFMRADKLFDKVINGRASSYSGLGGYDWDDAVGLFRHDAVTAYTGSAWTTGDILGFYIDYDNDAIWASKNGILENGATQGEVEAGTLTNAIWTGTLATDGPVLPYVGCDGGANMTFTLNSGQSALNTALYSGFKAICTANLPAPAVPNYEDEYYIEAGISHTNGATTAVTLPKTVSGGAMARIRRTDGIGGWYVFDTVRGTNTFSYWNLNTVEDTATFTDQNLTGTTFTIPSGMATGTYIIEVFYVGAYFQIDSYAGDTVAQIKTYDSALDSAPGFMAFFQRNNTTAQAGYHVSVGATKTLDIDLTTAAYAVSWFNNTEPTASGYSVGSTSATNVTGTNYVSYHWANSGPYAFGSLTHNGSTDGTNINLNGCPQAYWDKRDSAVSTWAYWADVVDADGNPVGQDFALEATNAPPVNSLSNDFNSTGVKYRDTRTTRTLVYGAFGITPIGGVGVAQGKAR